MGITIEQTQFEVVPTGEYPAKIQKVEEVSGQFGDQLKFTFELPPNEEGEKRTLLGWASAKFNPLSKLYGWTESALGGAPIDRGYNFNSDDIIGKPVTLVVIVKMSEKGEVNKIQSVLPYKKAKPAAAPPKEAPADW
jgi:hypothetical protein